MVTGAYHPEVSGGGIQCQELVRALRHRVRFTVLTTAANIALAPTDLVDGVEVHRVYVNAASLWSKLRAAARMTILFVVLKRNFQLVHFHGFSQKTMFLTALAKLFRKRSLLTLHTGGHDEPLMIRTRSRLAFWWYRQVDGLSAVSPRLQQRYVEAGLPAGRCRLILNGIDTQRFRPVEPDRRRALRRELGLSEHLRLILFVGVFSPEKRPDALFRAWSRLIQERGSAVGLIFVGATRSAYHEVDASLAEAIRSEASRLGKREWLTFVELTHEIERYYQAADLYVLSSVREGLPLALLEAMACGLPCIASRLEGVTDLVIDSGANGLLVPPGDDAPLTQALWELLADPARAQALGWAARATIERRFSITSTATQYAQLYQRLLDRRAPGLDHPDLDPLSASSPTERACAA